MILGIGMDVVSIERLRHWKEEPGILERFFHPDELAGARRRYNMEIPSLAARFAVRRDPGGRK